MRKKVVILGAAGRDFHNFNVRFKDDHSSEVVAFTAAQIPFIHDRIYPPELSGPLYPEGIPIYREEKLAEIIRSKKVDEAVFSYSDVSHEYMMLRASLAASLGADFILLGAESTMLRSNRPVVSVCAVRTGCGKSGVTRFIAREAVKAGKRPVVIRHPMPYGDILKQRAQRFEKYEDLERHGCTIEEMEEFEPLISEGIVVYAGIDYGEILTEAEKEADLIIWDGGNNDTPFIRPDLELTIADPLRPGHELKYYHGEVNVRRAMFVIINKANSATDEAVSTVIRNIRTLNQTAGIIKTASEVTVDSPIEGKRVLVVEDGPTLTHGGMDFGAGLIAARTHGAHPVDAAPFAKGSISETLSNYPNLKGLLPAMGYSKAQMKELEESINSTPCDAVLIATPVDLARVIKIKKPSVRVRYEVVDIESPGLRGVIGDFLKRAL